VLGYLHTASGWGQKNRFQVPGVREPVWGVPPSPSPKLLARISHQLFGIGFEGAESGDCGLTLSR